MLSFSQWWIGSPEIGPGCENEHFRGFFCPEIFLWNSFWIKKFFVGKCLGRKLPCCYVCRADAMLMLCLPRWCHTHVMFAAFILWPCYVWRADILVHVMFAALIPLFMLCLPHSCYAHVIFAAIMLFSCFVCRVHVLLILSMRKQFLGQKILFLLQNSVFLAPEFFPRKPLTLESFFCTILRPFNFFRLWNFSFRNFSP